METFDRGERQETNAGEAGYYSVEEAAKVLMLTRGRVRQMLRTGTLEGERGGSPRAPWRIPVHAVHALKEERPPRTDRGDVGQAGNPPEVSWSPIPETFEDNRELREKVEELQREIGRLEMHLEHAKTALQKGLEQEKRRTGREREERIRTQKEALRLREELAAQRGGKGLWRVGALVASLITIIAASLAVLNELFR